MTNKYSEELFGAIDTIIEKRLQNFNKDITILCNIEDNADAEEGKYVVSNSGLTFNAYSEKKDYDKNQRVWVLIPDGNYENTKMIIGRYVAADTVGFNYIDPLSSFVDMTGNICNSLISGLELGLIANNPGTTQLSFGTNLVPNGLDLTGFDKIGISADFRTTLKPIAGNYGLQFTITTDKVITNRNGNNQYYFETFRLSTEDMIGAVYSNTSWPQKIAFSFNPNEIGNITGISCNFYQEPGTFIYLENGEEKQCPYMVDNQLLSPNLFVKNLNIRLGFSSNKITGTTVLLKLAKNMKEYYNSDEASDPDNTKFMDFRFIYKNETGKYDFINTYNAFKEFQNKHDGYPKVYLYKQVSDSGYHDNRAGLGWKQESTWNESDNRFINNFQIKRELGSDLQPGTMRYKVCCAFKNPMPAADNIEKVLNSKRTNAVVLTDDEKYAITLFLSASYEDKEIYGDMDSNFIPIDGYYTDDNDERFPSIFQVLKEADKKYNDLKINDKDTNGNWVKVNSADILRNYIILQKQYELDNVTTTSFLDFLIGSDNAWIYKKYGTSESDYRKNFELAKAYHETIYSSDVITFIDKVDTTEAATNLIQGLRLTATDDKNGVYNIYKASENANSELIKTNDAYIKRNIEASFSSVTTGDESLDVSDRIYWLIPRYNTMIQEPVEGINYGEMYNLVLYTQTEFDAWVNDTSGSKGKLYYFKDGNYLDVAGATDEDKNNFFNGGKGRFYTHSIQKLVDKESETNESKILWNDIKNDDQIDPVEKTFLENALDSYYIIFEDKKNHEGGANFLKKASFTYQIKQTYRKSLNNNRIYAGVYRSNKLYTTSIELMFGVKGANGTDYTLSLTPGITNDFSNVWTRDVTSEISLKASVYDADDKLVTNQNTVYTFDLVFGDEYFNLIHESQWKIRPVTNAQQDKCKGAIISCRATNSGLGFDIMQYFILPVRTNQSFAYIEGPDSVIYDITNTNPNYYNVAYALKDKNDANIALTGVALETTLEGNNKENNIAYFPEIKANEESGDSTKYYYLVPKATYVEDVNYKCYVAIETNNGSWYQPLLISVNKYANSSITSIKTGIDIKDTNVDSNTNKSVSTIMSSLKKSQNDNKLTGIVIGNLPKQGNNERSGILGYLNDTEVFGLLDGGKAFIGMDQGIYLDNNGKIVINANKCVIDGLKISKSQINDFSHTHTVSEINGAFNVSKIINFNSEVIKAINANNNSQSITHLTIDGVRYAVSVVNTGTIFDPIYSLQLTK